MKQLLVLLIRFYQYAISPLLGRRCRFSQLFPEYTAEAIQKYGVWKS